MGLTKKKAGPIQMKLAKAFNRGGARKGAGRPKNGGEKRTVWLSPTTLAMWTKLKEANDYSDDQLISAGLIALADLALAGRLAAVKERVQMPRRADIPQMPGN